MGKIVSKIQTVFGRVIKAIVVAALIPVAVGLLVGVLGQFASASVSGVNVARWLAWGFCTYLGVHILLYRPAGLFRISRTMFSTLAVWLFGGQRQRGGALRRPVGPGAADRAGNPNPCALRPARAGARVRPFRLRARRSETRRGARQEAGSPIARRIGSAMIDAEKHDDPHSFVGNALGAVGSRRV